MTNYFIVPGLGNSGELHWQSNFERSGDNFKRIEQKEWDAPVCSDWIATIDETLKGYDLSTVVLVGHSLACATIAQWAIDNNKQIRGALLVAPSDLEATGYDFPAVGFSVPKTKIPFRTIVVASTNDPWVTIDRAKHFAEMWGSEFINIGDAGHINVDAGYTEWPEGMEILKRL